MHPWHYSSLIHDIIGIKNNKVSLKSKETKNQKVDYELDVINDQFWKKSINTPFPCVGEDLEKEVQTWKKEYDQMGHKKQGSDVKETSENLNEAMDQIPEMTDRKKRIDIHNNIATHLLREIDRRSLDQFFELEYQLLSGQKISSEELEFLKTMNNFDEITDEQQKDIARLISIYYISDSQDNVLDQFTKKFIKKSNSKYVQSILYIKDVIYFYFIFKDFIQHIKELFYQQNKLLKSPLQQKRQGGAFNFVTGFAKSIKNHGKGMLKYVQKKLDDEAIIGIGDTVYEVITDPTSEFVQKRYKSYNPLTRNYQKDFDLSKIENCFVFVSDGGSYIDYQNMDKISEKLKINIIYGASNLFTAEQYIEQFIQLQNIKKQNNDKNQEIQQKQDEKESFL